MHAMMQFLTNSLRYLRDVLTQWIAYLFFLPNAYDLVRSWLLKQPPDFSKQTLVIFAALFFVLANFKLYHASCKREAKLRYEIRDLKNTGVNYRIISNVQYMESSQEMQAAKNKLAEVQSPHYNKRLLFGMPFFDKNLEKYIDELSEYCTALNTYSLEQKKIPRVHLSIENTGNVADENVSIVITASDNISFADDYDHIKPVMPSEPSPAPASYFSGDSGNLFLSHGMPVREIVSHSKKKMEIEIHKVRVGEQIDILNDSILCQFSDDANGTLYFEIKSKMTRSPMYKEVPLFQNQQTGHHMYGAGTPSFSFFEKS
jgi:hypothetical protein